LLPSPTCMSASSANRFESIGACAEQSRPGSSRDAAPAPREAANSHEVKCLWPKSVRSTPPGKNTVGDSVGQYNRARVANNRVAPWNNLDQPIKPTISALAKSLGRAAGVVTSVEWSHATPAGCSHVHVSDPDQRQDTECKYVGGTESWVAIEAQGSRDATLVIVTADPETGLLWAPNSDTEPFQHERRWPQLMGAPPRAGPHVVRAHLCAALTAPRRRALVSSQGPARNCGH
jgi:hypothetical protein